MSDPTARYGDGVREGHRAGWDEAVREVHDLLTKAERLGYIRPDAVGRWFDVKFASEPTLSSPLPRQKASVPNLFRVDIEGQHELLELHERTEKAAVVADDVQDRRADWEPAW